MTRPDEGWVFFVKLGSTKVGEGVELGLIFFFKKNWAQLQFKNMICQKILYGVICHAISSSDEVHEQKFDMAQQKPLIVII